MSTSFGVRTHLIFTSLPEDVQPCFTVVIHVAAIFLWCLSSHGKKNVTVNKSSFSLCSRPHFAVDTLSVISQENGCRVNMICCCSCCSNDEFYCPLVHSKNLHLQFWRAMLGLHSHSDHGQDVQTRQVDHIVIHRRYNRQTKQADVAMMQLRTPVHFSGQDTRSHLHFLWSLVPVGVMRGLEAFPACTGRKAGNTLEKKNSPQKLFQMNI